MDIKFNIREGHTIPFELSLSYIDDDNSITYVEYTKNDYDTEFIFKVHKFDPYEAMKIVNNIAVKICSENEDKMNNIRFQSEEIKIIELSDILGYIKVSWKYSLRNIK